MHRETVIRLAAIVILIVWRLIWFQAGKAARRTTGKSVNRFLIWEKAGMYAGGLYTIAALGGYTVFSFHSMTAEAIGFIFVVAGCSLAIAARFRLGINWTEAYEYQIKKNHRLIKDGVYRFVRHPIYGGVLIAVTGAYLTAQTWLFIPVSVCLFFFMRYMAKREEKILTGHFGEEYRLYLKTSRMLVPFVF